MRYPLLVGTLSVALLAPMPAWAVMGGERSAFEHYLYRVPRAHWQVVPDSTDGGSLYAGRIGSFSTIVHVFYDRGRISRQKVEVALPTETRDDVALSILARFLSEFVGHPEEGRAAVGMLRAMRRTLLASGRRSTQMPYRRALYTLTLDSSATEFSAKTIDVPWGVLYWRGEAVARRHD